MKTLNIKSKPFLKAFQLFAILSLLFALCVSCGSQKVVTQTVERVQKDTVYLSNIQYDSIYIYQDKFIDRSRDTLYVKDKSIEYRYKLLRDTIKVVQRDSIPYEVTVIQTKEITRPLTWFDHLTRACFWLLCGVVFVRLVFKIKKL